MNKYSEFTILTKMGPFFSHYQILSFPVIAGGLITHHNFENFRKNPMMTNINKIKKLE